MTKGETWTHSKSPTPKRRDRHSGGTVMNILFAANTLARGELKVAFQSAVVIADRNEFCVVLSYGFSLYYTTGI